MTSEALADAWKWVRLAPLPVVLAFVLALASWVYVIDVDQRAETIKSAAVAQQVNGMDGKLDKLLDGMAELRAEQRQVRRELRLSTPAPTPKEK